MQQNGLFKCTQVCDLKLGLACAWFHKIYHPSHSAQTMENWLQAHDIVHFQTIKHQETDRTSEWMADRTATSNKIMHAYEENETEREKEGKREIGEKSWGTTCILMQLHNLQLLCMCSSTCECNAMRCLRCVHLQSPIYDSTMEIKSTTVNKRKWNFNKNKEIIVELKPFRSSPPPLSLVVSSVFYHI